MVVSSLGCCSLAVLIVDETLVTIHVSWLRQDLVAVAVARLHSVSGAGSSLEG